MSTEALAKGRTGDSLWEKARVNLSKLVEKIILSLENSKQGKKKKGCQNTCTVKQSENFWAFQNSCETCICSGANHTGKMPLTEES